MGVQLRLCLLRLRQKFNFRLFRLLMVLSYVAITILVVVYHFSSDKEGKYTLVSSWTKFHLLPCS